MDGSGSNEHAIVERLRFIGLDEPARARLKSLQTLIERSIGPALDLFYNKMRANPNTSRFFADEKHIAGAKSRQAQHWGKIGAAAFDEDYLQGVLRVGKTHARIGLEPRWYIGSYALIVEQFIHAIVKEKSSRRFRFGGGHEQAMAEDICSVVKAAMLDMELAVSVYLETIDEKRREAEAAGRAAVDQERMIVADSIGVGLEKLAAKDLTHRLDAAVPDAYRALQNNFNAAIEQLAGTMQSVAGSVGAISSGTQELSTASDDLARRTEQQAAGIEQTAAALSEIVATVKRAAESASHASRVVGTAKEDAEKSGTVVRRAVEAMNAISASSQQISQIIVVIDEIAFQTNLLALNAGVEAARAGDVGRGFAVVASEVRALAQRSAEAAKEIKGLISTSSSQVGQGVELVAQTGQALERIVGQVKEINDVVAEIAAGARAQATGLDEINSAINQMDQVTQQNAGMVEEATASIHTLSAETGQLSELISQFDVGGAAHPGRGAGRGEGRRRAG